MKLKEVYVANFRNFRDSTPVQIQPDVTCLVGKNESGKTAFLHALYRFLPARENVKFSVLEHYPAWLEKRDCLDGKNLEKFVPIRAVFEFEAADVAAFEEKFGPETLQDRKITLEKNYEGMLFYSVITDEHAAIRACLAPLKLATKFSDDIKEVKTFKDLRAYAAGLVSKIIMTKTQRLCLRVRPNCQTVRSISETLW